MNFELISLPLIAFFTTFFTTPWIRDLAKKYGLVDVPNGRKMHKSPVPYGGGVAIFLGFLVAFALLGNYPREIAGFFLGALLIVALGIFDDKISLRAIPKLSFQIIAALVAIYFGAQIDMSLLLRGSFAEFQYLSIPLTLFWIVGITNAINLIDGLDGLAAGVVTISAATLAAVSWINGSHEVALISLILAASAVGFLPHNMRTKVFMGDTGSMFLGYSLATLAVLGSVKLAAAFSFFVPVIILAIPIFDTLFAIVRRVISGKSIFHGDKKHLHHRLLEMGFSVRQTVVFIYILSLVFGGLAVYSSLVSARKAYLLFAVAGLIVLFGSWFLVYLHQKRCNGGKRG